MKNRNLKNILVRMKNEQPIQLNDSEIEFLNDDLMYSVKGGTTVPPQGCSTNCQTNCGVNINV